MIMTMAAKIRTPQQHRSLGAGLFNKQAAGKQLSEFLFHARLILLLPRVRARRHVISCRSEHASRQPAHTRLAPPHSHPREIRTRRAVLYFFFLADEAAVLQQRDAACV